MTERFSINEKALLYRLECPLRSNGSSTLPESPVLTCAENTARWLIAEPFTGRAPTAAETREFFDPSGHRRRISSPGVTLRQRNTSFAFGRVCGLADGCATLSGGARFSNPYPRTRCQSVTS